MSKDKGPLAGLKVVELAHIMAGPCCGLMLADLGAEVVKLEKMPGGDDTRRYRPPEIRGEAATFMMMNRNKRGIAINLKEEQGRRIAQRLILGSDVVIENYRRGTMERLGLGYETLSKDNPGLIYCEISGFGRSGPYADRGGFDLIAQGMSGLMSITGEGPGRQPVKLGAPVTDITAGILGALGVVAAYANRLSTGRGQRVDTSLFEAGIIHTFWQSAIALASGVSPGPMGSAHPVTAPYQAFQTADGWVNVGAANQANWLRLVEALGASQLKDEPRFAESGSRLENRVALADALAPYFKEKTTEAWLSEFEKIGLPAGPVLSIGEMHRDQQTLARQMVVEQDHPVAGKVRTLGTPIKFSATPGDIERPAPLYGEHTREVLEELGYTTSEIEAFAKSGIIHLN